MTRAVARPIWIVCLSAALLAQSEPPPRRFEVASVKLHQGPGRIGISTSGPRLNAVAAGPLLLIMYAFNLKSYQISRTSALLALGDEFYDIAAKAEGDVAPAQDEFRGMLQLLLADRFQLRVHRETREVPVYALVVGKNGPKFKPSVPGASPDAHYAASGRNYELTIPGATMDDVLKAIENSGQDGAYRRLRDRDDLHSQSKVQSRDGARSERYQHFRCGRGATRPTIGNAKSHGPTSRGGSSGEAVRELIRTYRYLDAMGRDRWAFSSSWMPAKMIP
jgi:uncharacterized protein (TIGR03435 family)